MVLTTPTIERFRLILHGLFAVLGAWQLPPGVAVHAHNRFGQIFQQITRMLLRFRAGRLRKMPQRRSANPAGTRVRQRGQVLPRRFGWLVQAGKHQAAGYGSQLHALLNDQEMVALLAAAPQAGRLLRPLCRALALELPWVIDRPRPLRERKPPAPRRRGYAVAADFTRPLPRGTLAWARREGFGKRPQD